MQAVRAEGTNERHGTLRENEGSRIDGVQFLGTIAVQNGGNMRVLLRPTPNSGT